MREILSERPLFLAPMSGVTDPAFRAICAEFGADVCVSEFVYSRAVLLKIPKIMQKLRFEANSVPYGIQLFGSDEFEVADAAVLLEEVFKPDFIDINFGCPAPNAVGAGAGSALLKTPKLMQGIVKRVAESLKCTPVSAKLRLGWSASEIIVPDVALMLEDAGAKFLALHGRTKTQGYMGDADWGLINKTALALKIPLIGNGSVQNLSQEELLQSPCRGFMLGRAAIGNPWIFKELKARLSSSQYFAPDAYERVNTALKYLEKASVLFDDLGATQVRQNVLGFLKDHSGFKKMREVIALLKSPDEIRAVLLNFFEK